MFDFDIALFWVRKVCAILFTSRIRQRKDDGIVILPLDGSTVD